MSDLEIASEAFNFTEGQVYWWPQPYRDTHLVTTDVDREAGVVSMAVSDEPLPSVFHGWGRLSDGGRQRVLDHIRSLGGHEGHEVTEPALGLVSPIDRDGFIRASCRTCHRSIVMHPTIAADADGCVVYTKVGLIFDAARGPTWSIP